MFLSEGVKNGCSHHKGFHHPDKVVTEPNAVIKENAETGDNAVIGDNAATTEHVVTETAVEATKDGQNQPEAESSQKWANMVKNVQRWPKAAKQVTRNGPKKVAKSATKSSQKQ